MCTGDFGLPGEFQLGFRGISGEAMRINWAEELGIYA